MRKNKKGGALLTLFFAMVAAIVFFFGCTTNECNGSEPPRSGGEKPEKPFTIEDYTRELGTFEGLSAETEWRIIRDFFHYRRQEGYISEYCGTYSGYIVVEIFTGALTRQYIAPIIIANVGYIEQSPAFYTLAWKNGQFYRLEELYNQNELTQRDMRNIASRHHRFIKE